MGKDAYSVAARTGKTLKMKKKQSFFVVRNYECICYKTEDGS